MKKALRISLKAVISALAAILLVAIIYVGYVLISYSRIEDNLALNVQKAAQAGEAKLGEEYSAICYNIGFGAYSPDFTFFMDGGKESWAESEESVKTLVSSAADLVRQHEPDIVLFQEVDLDSTRSYHINQEEILDTRFKDFDSVRAINYQSAFLFYPFNEPHGASNSCQMTYIRFAVSSAVRRSLPISTSFSKFLDLDRCYSKSRIAVEGGRELIVYNVHMSAYGGSDEIRAAQMGMLFEDMKAEYDKGNYTICGGDFNHDFTGSSTQDLNGGADADFGWAQPFPKDLLPEGIERCTNYTALSPTCRNCDIPYKEGNFTIIVDGFLVSDNVEVKSTENINTGFEFSDHNPVEIKFVLK